MTNTELRIEMWPINQPRPYESNPRVNDKAVDAVAASISFAGDLQLPDRGRARETRKIYEPREHTPVECEVPFH